jgi:transposase
MTRTAERGISPELAAQMTPAVRAFVLALSAEIDQLRAEVRDLKSQLADRTPTPANSSVPPSTQHPHAKPTPTRPRSRKKRGGQAGHPKHARALVPTDECDRVVPLAPTTCRRCHAVLSGTDATPLRHQVWELPEIKPVVTEYQRHRLTCNCGATTCADLPTGVPLGQSAPRLVAFTGLLMAYFRQSKRRAALFLEALLGQPCSAALAVKMQHQVTAALQPSYDALVAQLPTQPHLGIDESPTKQAASKAWLWTFVAKWFTVFAIRPTRKATILDDLLGDRFGGVVMCDRAKMYYQLGRVQWCWAHLKRDIQALIDSADPQVRRLGYDLMRPCRELFRQWSRCRDGTITRAELKRVLTPTRQVVDGLVLRGAFSGNERLVGMCRELYAHRDWLWTFLDHVGVEPTNNASERSLRHAVIWRKLSFGTQSERGSRFVETLLSVIETCRQQKRNVFAFVTAAVEAHFARRPAPLLLAGG